MSPMVCITSSRSGVVMNPLPSLSNTWKASLTSSSMSESLKSLDRWEDQVLHSLGHQPDKLIETDVSIAILVDHTDKVLELLLCGRPAKSPHHLSSSQINQLVLNLSFELLGAIMVNS